MKPSELYAKTAGPITRPDLYNIDFLWGFYYDHMPEVNRNHFRHETNERVTVRSVYFTCPDGRRIWHLACVYLDDNPFMVIQNAGREGDDHAARFITDPETYVEVVQYFISLYETDAEASGMQYVDADTDVPNLDEFYGYNLRTVHHYERRSY